MLVVAVYCFPCGSRGSTVCFDSIADLDLAVCAAVQREGVWAGLGEREAKLNPGRGGGKAIQPLFLLAGAADTTNTILPSSLSLS